MSMMLFTDDKKSLSKGERPTSDFVWNIDHIDGNPNNNEWQNLQPMRLECNNKKKHNLIIR